MEQHSIKVRIRDSEFEASGERDAVNAQYEAFLKVVAMLPAGGPPVSGTSATTSTNGTNGAKPSSSTSQPTGNAGDLLRDLRERAFRLEGEIVSLNALPRTENSDFDTVTLLLYGYRHLRGQTTVIVGDLLEGLRQSGASPSYQMSKLAANYRTLVTQAGVKRASRYGLTDTGQSHAEEVLRNLF